MSSSAHYFFFTLSEMKIFKSFTGFFFALYSKKPVGVNSVFLLESLCSPHQSDSVVIRAPFQNQSQCFEILDGTPTSEFFSEFHFVWTRWGIALLLLSYQQTSESRVHEQRERHGQIFHYRLLRRIPLTSFLCADLPDFHTRDISTGTQCAGHSQQPLLGQSVVTETAHEDSLKKRISLYFTH